jgi:predicted dithiol-disulfide oxidoreductase (DUF899 family)
MALPDVVSEDEWRAARVEVLRDEKALTRAHDALSTKRREMPMVEVTKTYTFAGPGGVATLLDLFEGRAQLIVGHFMFDPSWDDGCQSCTAGADEIADGLLDHLHTRETTFAYVSRAPLAKIEDYKRRRGWTFPWYSSFGSDFNYDFHVTLDPSVAPLEYNFRTAAEFEAVGEPLPPLAPGESMELPGRSHFLRVGDRVFHTNSIYARGLETMGGSYYLLDETALGRQEDWEQPLGRAGSVRGNVPSFTE